MVKMLNNMLEWIESRFDRIRCRTIKVHGTGCRGRLDHDPRVGRWL